MYIVIVGGGNVGYYLAKALTNTTHEVLLMEKDRNLHRQLAEELGEVAMQGDASEVRLLEEAGVGRADVVVAVTAEDDDNLVICQMAKMKFNVPRTIARINDPRNESLFQQLGIDATVSSTKIIYNLLEQEIETGEVIPLAALRRGNIEIVQIEIGPKSPVLGQKVLEVALPEDSLVISLIRNEHGMLPTTDSRFEVGDAVIGLVRADQEPQVRQLFVESTG